MHTRENTGGDFFKNSFRDIEATDVLLCFLVNLLFIKSILTAEICLKKKKCSVIYTEKTYKVFITFSWSFLACPTCEQKT